VFDVVTSGAESDLESATRLARSMVGRWGMSEKIGPVSVLPAEGDPRLLGGASSALLDLVDAEVHRISDECLAEARRLIGANRDKLDAIVTELLARETLDEAEVYAAAGIPRGAKALETPAPVEA
jgi:cell division protease FtsH